MTWPLSISILGLIVSAIAFWWTYTVGVGTQRAFVFIKDFQVYVLGTGVVVMPRWQNTGSTPTRRMTNYVNWMFFEGGFAPADYKFPDLNADGSSRDTPGIGIKFFIGPKGEQFSQKLIIPTAVTERARKGEGHIYVWGWASYEDIFPFTRGHITRFCNEIEITGLEIDDTTRAVKAGISFRLHDKNNCIDGECD